jgi:hypothetical protein
MKAHPSWKPRVWRHPAQLQDDLHQHQLHQLQTRTTTWQRLSFRYLHVLAHDSPGAKDATFGGAADDGMLDVKSFGRSARKPLKQRSGKTYECPVNVLRTSRSF